MGRNLFFCRYCDTISRLPRIENDAKELSSLSLSLGILFPLFDETRVCIVMDVWIRIRYRFPQLFREKTDGVEKTPS